MKGSYNQSAMSGHQNNMNVGNLQANRNGKGNSGKQSWQSSQNHIWAQLSKTKMCKYKLQGTCTKGKACNFAHDEVEMQGLPDLSCTKLCAQFLQVGKCDNPACTYAHSKDELRATSDFHKTKMCRFWPLGSCELGNKCRFAHCDLELRPAFDSPKKIADDSSAAPPRPHQNFNQNGKGEISDNQDAYMQHQNSRPSGKGQGKKRLGDYSTNNHHNNGFRRNRDESEGQVVADVQFQSSGQHEESSSRGFPAVGQVRGQQANSGGSESMYVGPNNWSMQGKDGEWSSNNHGYVNYGDIAGAVWLFQLHK
jgi:hypothetical protein